MRRKRLVCSSVCSLLRRPQCNRHSTYSYERGHGAADANNALEVRCEPVVEFDQLPFVKQPDIVSRPESSPLPLCSVGFEVAPQRLGLAVRVDPRLELRP